MKKLSRILTLSALLSAPFVAHAEPDDDLNLPLGSNPIAISQTEVLPSVLMSEELMFKYLSAELADQRGNAFAAYSTMLSIARTTRDPRLARRAVEMAMKGKLVAEALKAARAWQEISPQSDEVAQLVLSLQLATNQTEEAKKVLAKRLAGATAQSLPGTVAQVQRLLSRMTDKAKSASLLRELLEPYRDSLDVRLTLAQMAMVAGDQALALREARDALAKNPASELAALTLAQVTLDKTEAATMLGAFLQKNPAAREVRMALGRMLFEQSKIPEAKKEFKVLLDQNPQDQTALYALGLLSVQVSDLADAETYLSAYIKNLQGKPDRERDATQALMVLTQIAEDRGDIASALQWINLVEPTGQNNYLGAVLKRAQLIAKDGKLAQARQILSEMDVESDDDRIRLIIGEAQLLRDANQLGESIRLLNEALDRFPDNTDLLYEQAMVVEKNNQFDLMEQSLRKIIALTPDNQHAYTALGYSFAERNVRLPEAYDLIKKALSLAPDDAYIMDSMGWVEFRLGRLESAEEILRRAYAIKPDAEVAVHLGEVLWMRGREEEAKKLWRIANGKDPKNESLKGTLLRLQIKL